jgi:tetratricopeptide (TPR) repeat protein
MLFRYAAVFCLCLVLHLPCLSASDESNVFFNAGTEKYLQGRFAESIDDLEKAQKLSPANKKISEFMTKILLDAATQSYLGRNYRQALQYLEKAKQIAPDSPKVQEMYQTTRELLGTAKEEPSASGINMSHLKAQAALPVNGGEKRVPARENAPSLRKAPAVPTTENGRGPKESIPVSPLPAVPERVIYAFAAMVALSLFFLIMFIVKASAAGRLRKLLNGSEEKVRDLQDGKNVLVTEIEKLKERSKYEHESIELLRRELKDKDKKEEEHLRVELELRGKEIEEKIRADVYAQNGGDGFLRSQQAKILESMGKQDVNDESSATLDVVRERISLMAENLYEYAPGKAMEYLRRTVADGNPLVRSNIVRALSRLAVPESIDLLFGLYADTDYGVKREVLKALKQLQQKISSNAVTLDPGVEQKIKTLISQEKAKGEWII